MSFFKEENKVVFAQQSFFAFLLLFSVAPCRFRVVAAISFSVQYIETALVILK